VPLPHRRPDVVSRTGIDLNPLDVTDADDVAWLSACIWPEHTERQARLAAAASVATLDPPDLVRGDLVDTIDQILAEVPADVTPVVFHSAVLGYLDRDRRTAFQERMLANPRALWISNEGPGVIEGLTTTLTPPADATSLAHFVVGVGGDRVVALHGPHGSWLAWAAD
jgi:hypothetical protein